jgi:hypothetical protein
MGAMIKLNGVWLGNATDQFLRYQFMLNASLLAPTDNVLSVSFGGELMIATGARFTGSGQIDWAPDMNHNLTMDPTDPHRTGLIFPQTILVEDTLPEHTSAGFEANIQYMYV